MNKLVKIILVVQILFSIACNDSNNQSKNVIIGIAADVESLNPLFAFHANEAAITELIFLSLVKHEWDPEKASLKAVNMLAESVQWDYTDNSVLIKIRDDVYWSDSVQCTVDDVILSFDLYSDPQIQSRALGMFENYFLTGEGKIEVEKTFSKVSEFELKINFAKGTKPSTLDIDHPIIPAHIFSEINREEISTNQFNTLPVTCGPYKLKNWNKEQSIVLIRNTESFLGNDMSPEEIIFKVVPNYASLVLQLKGGEIDFINDVKPEDAAEFIKEDKFDVKLSQGRQYDYIGWNNIEPSEFENDNKLVPHRLFGDVSVRRALSHAINRDEVLNNFLYDYGQAATGPISNNFLLIDKDELKPADFNIDKAKQMLSDAGWIDSNNDGVLDKDGVEFKFNLYVPSGEPRREFAANIFNNNFKELGIDVNIQFVAMNSFIDGLFAKQYDAWMIGWTNPIPLNLRIQWYSDLEETPFNLPSYQNKKVDELLDIIDSDADELTKARAYKEINTTLFNEQPFCFLYWIDGIAVHNSRIKNVTVNPLGSIQNCWEWKLN